MSTTRQRPTRHLSGHAKSRYLRKLIELAGAPADVGTKIDGDIVAVLVRDSSARVADNVRPAKRRIVPVGSSVVISAAPAEPSVAPLVGSTSVAVPAVSSPAPAKPQKPVKGGKASKSTPTAQATAVGSTFNPYGFSAMAVLLNEGRAALENLLGQVANRDQFKQLADAQSVRIDPDLLGDRSVSMEKLRAAFVDSVQQRIAHRRAISG